ncbi:MAG: T9SS type A sorting domain-containing protein [Chitinophagaceae bacterium]
MFQRLLILLMVFSVSNTAFSQDVMTPADGDYVYNSSAAAGSLTNPTPLNPALNQVQKWVHDPSQKNRIGSFQTVYKSYRIGSMSYRLRFPKNYSPSTTKYPMVIFLHGQGEAAARSNANNDGGTNNRENQDQLYWGAENFSGAIDFNEFNGFLLFPQLTVTDQGAGAEWANVGSISPINSIIDTLVKYNGLDQDRTIVMGLSAGGLGCLYYAATYPTRIATVVTSAPEQVGGSVSTIPNFLQIPVWLGAGGLDGGSNGCDPSLMMNFQDNFIKQGGNIYTTYSVNEGHVMWNTQWYQKDVNNRSILDAYWNSAHKAQPLVYFQTTEFCSGSAISAKMGISPNLGAYEWQVDNGSGFTTIPGATSNIYTATAAGTYRVHFKRTGSSTFSDWTPVPVVIKTKKCAATLDTAFVEHFDINRDWTAAAVYKPGSYGCQNGIVTSGTDSANHIGSISQDGAGNFAGRFMLNSTVSACTYTTNDEIWRNYLHPVTVQSGVTYSLNFSIANQNNCYTNAVDRVSPANAAAIVGLINGTAVSPAGGVKAKGFGNTSWRKYSYTWTATSNSDPTISFVNKTSTNTWNDFLLDEISLVKYKAPVLPGAAYTNLTLWARANSLKYADNYGVAIWNNEDVNGDNLVQTNTSIFPVYKNNATDNLNFNPVVNFYGSGSSIQDADGFSGSAAHTAVTAYVVSKVTNTTQDNKNLFIENQNGTNVVKATLNNNGVMSWTAGTDPSTNTLSTATGAIEINKPIVWSFSKDNANTASGNRQDIRKNGLIVASVPATAGNMSSFTGSNSPFGLGNTQPFEGSVAEVIYLLDSAVTPVRQNKIESYLGVKYGTTMGSTATPFNYTASDGTTVFWPGVAAFQNDVFGIGTDSASGLVQKKSNSANSGSGDGTGQFAKGNIVLTTNTDLSDKNFLMIGNDAGALTQVVIASGPGNGKTRLSRNWKVVNTGANGGVAAVDLSFDTTGLASLAGGPVLNQYALMIDKDGDNTLFNSASFVTATGVVGNKLIFANLNLPNGSYFTLITNNLNSALPAIWLGFTATAVNGDGLLDWKTSEESNVDRYVVEHSFNGVSFTAIGSVVANNSTGTNDYTYTDKGLAAGVHYYRIRRVDKDGKSEYSETRTIKIVTAGANVQIMPNPVVGSALTLSVAVPQASKTMMQIMSVDGKVLMQRQLNLAMGSNLVTVDVSYVPSGIYLLQVQLNDGAVTRKFIRQH